MQNLKLACATVVLLALGCQRRSKSRPLGRSKNRPILRRGHRARRATAAPAEMAGVS